MWRRAEQRRGTEESQGTLKLMWWLVVLVMLLSVSVCDRILVVMDNRNLESTHSQLLEVLRQNHQLELAYSFGKQSIELKEYDVFKYDHIFIMCTAEKEIQSKIKVKDILSYFDEGGNVVVIGDIDSSFSFRKLYYGLGLEIDEPGSILRDHFSQHQGNVDLIVTRNYEPLYPFFELPTSSPLIYKGVGMSLVNYDNYQLYGLLRVESTTFSKSLTSEKVLRAGTGIILAAGIQGLNNARALVVGSLHFFSDAAFNMQWYANKRVAQEMLHWVLKQNGMIRLVNMNYHGEGVDTKERLFNVGENIHFEAELEEYDAKREHWQPFITNDLQIELVMLDPWVRTTLTHLKDRTYVADFTAPQKEGIYKFRISYRRPGYTFLQSSERVTIRPYKHDEFERFLFVAAPYTFGTFSTILCTFIFILIYLYSWEGKAKKE